MISKGRFKRLNEGSKEVHYTATVYLFRQGKILLHPHPKFGKWLPPGGHVEVNETPPEAARREVLEETGLSIAFLEQEGPEVNFPNAVTIERPFLCLLENVPAHKETPAHQHIDFIYLAENLGTEPPHPPFRWVSREELENLELFLDTREILMYLSTSDRGVFR